MDKNVDAFAARIRNDAQLAGGFNCVGFSQGNSLCRGYIQKYNDPPSLLFQLDYFRDPMRVNTTAYRTHSQLAQWNNEGLTFNETYKRNFASVKRFLMIKALKDSMVYPNEGEHWGHFADGSLTKVLTMRETQWYQQDLFGLKTADLAGKIHFNTTSGNHLRFSQEELIGWIETFAI